MEKEPSIFKIAESIATGKYSEIIQKICCLAVCVQQNSFFLYVLQRQCDEQLEG